MNMVEKVARALEPNAWAALDGQDNLAHNHMRIASMQMARAAIEAMMVPTPEMLKAVEDEEGRQGYCYAAYECMSAEDGWPVMIQAALKEGQ